MVTTNQLEILVPNIRTSQVESTTHKIINRCRDKKITDDPLFQVNALLYYPHIYFIFREIAGWVLN